MKPDADAHATMNRRTPGRKTEYESSLVTAFSGSAFGSSDAGAGGLSRSPRFSCGTLASFSRGSALIAGDSSELGESLGVCESGGDALAPSLAPGVLAGDASQ